MLREIARLLPAPMTALVVVAAVALAGPAEAFVIDSFDDPQSAIAESGNFYVVNAALGSMLGGDRDTIAHYHYGPNSINAEIDDGGSSVYHIGFGAGTFGHSEVHYDGIGAVGLGGVDFTSGGSLNAVVMHVPLADSPTNITITARTGLNRSSLLLSLPGGIASNTTVPFFFDDFVLDFGTGADFAALDRLEVAVRPQAEAANVQIDLIETAFVAAAVPEPSTYVLAVLGLLGLGLLGWRRKRLA